MKRGRKKPSREQRAAHDRFRVLVRNQPCLFRGRPGHRCDGPLDAHHVLKEQAVRNHHSLLYMRREDPERFWSIVHDPRLGVALCRAAHEPVTLKSTHLFFNELPPDLFEAVEEYGFESLLERECRPGSFSATSDP